MLILLRRFAALFLILPFVLFFILTLAAFRVDATLLDADFYADTLQKLNFYNFLYDQGVPAALEEAEFDLEKDLPLGLSFTTNEVVSSLKRVLPPEWAQANVESAIAQAVPYFTGDEERFSVTVKLDERVASAIEVAEEWIRDADTYTFLIDEVVEPEVVKNRGLLNNLPYGLSLTPRKIVAGVVEVVPQQWLDQRVGEVVDEVTPYIIGKRDSFSVLIPLQDRADAALPVLEGWLLEALESGAYDYLLQEQMAPTVRRLLGDRVELPFGVTVTGDEIVETLALALPPDWVADRVTDAIDAFGPYLTGRQDSFTISIPLQERARVAVGGLADTVSAKYETLFDSLPTCSLSQLPGLRLSLDELPECRPPGASFAVVAGLVGLDVSDVLNESVVEGLPADIKFTQVDLEAAVGNAVDLKQVRGYLKNGLVFTDRDLRKLVLERAGQEELDLFDEVREALRDGITFTDQDLRKELGSDVDVLDQVRDRIGQASSFLLVLLAPLAVLILLSGFLGGRTWWSRLAWAGVPLFLSGVVVAGGIGAVIAAVKTFTDDPIRELEFSQVIIDKLLEVRVELIDLFLRPVLLQGVLALSVGLAMVLMGVFAPVLLRRRRRARAG